ncbi:hypothetical protein AB0L41_45245 [Amycolatopsis mediterranei]|uniref:hypothetical protein n=1 Tax=Amycolatopsis mediterranei TaxID=33910 RepID=UPI00342A6F25
MAAPAVPVRVRRYVATYARFQYFGLDLTALDLSTTEVVPRGAEALYAPLAGG